MIAKLIDSISENDKEKIILETVLLPRKIFLLDCEFTEPPKPKFLIFVGIFEESTPLFIVINSKVHTLIENNPDLRICQVKMKSSEYEFLDYDSFANCADVIDSFDIQEIINQISDNPDIDKGMITQDTIKKIRNVVKRAKTISSIYKECILGYLK